MRFRSCLLLLFFYPSLLAAQLNNWIQIHNSFFNDPLRNISAIELDSAGFLWVGTYGYHADGILRYKDGSWFTPLTKYNWYLPDNVVYDLLYDHLSNTMCIATQSGIVLNNDTSTTVYDNTNSPIPIYSPSCLALDAYGNFWFGEGYCGGGDVIAMKPDGWMRYDYSNSPLPMGVFISDISFDKKNNLWVSAIGQGLFKFDGMAWSHFDTSNSGLTTNLVYYAEDDSGVIWIGTDNGVCTYDGSFWNYKTGNETWDVAFDKDNNTWVGCDQCGLIVLPSYQIINPSNSNFETYFVRDIDIDQQGKIWVAGTQSIDVYDPSNNTSVELVSNPQHSISCHPNPFKDQIMISNAKVGWYYLRDLYGRILIAQNSNAVGTLVLNTSNIPSGTYMLIFEKDFSSLLVTKT